MQKTAAIMKTEPICIHRATFRNAVPVNLICSETVAEEYKLSYHNTTKYSNLKESYPEQSETNQRKKMMLWNLTELQLNTRGKITTSRQAAWVFSKHNKPYTGLDEAAVWSELIDIQATSDMKAALQRCSGSEWPRDLDSTIGYRLSESLSTVWVACPQEYDTRWPCMCSPCLAQHTPVKLCSQKLTL